MADRDTLLTITQVRAWDRRFIQIREEIERLTAEQHALGRKLQAARFFMPAPGSEEEEATEEATTTTAAPEPTKDEPDESLSDAVIEAVGQYSGTAPTPRTIRRHIVNTNPALGAKLAASPNYFYTVLMRHVQRGRLTRQSNGGYTLPNDSPKGETGAVAAPAPSQSPSQSIEAASDGPKGNGVL